MNAAAAHLHDEELHSYLQARQSHALSSWAKDHLLHCADCENRLTTAVVSKLEELSQRPRGYRRTEARQPSNEKGSLQAVSPLSFERVPIRVLDVSTTGCRVSGPKALEVGTMVLIQVGTASNLGEVRVCRKVGPSQFQVGIHLSASARLKH